MDATQKAIRAIASEFFLRVYKPVVLSIAVVFLILIGICVWLVTLSAWWWLLFAVVLLWLLIAISLFLFSYAIIARVRPEQTKAQKQQLRTLVDKIEHAKEVTMMPKFMLLFKIVQDAYKPSNSGFIASVSDEALSLKDDFLTYRNTFTSR